MDKFSRVPSPADFAEMVRKAFEAAGIPGFEYREADFALKMAGRDTTIFLTNSYASYRSLPRNKRQEVIAKLVAGFGAIPELPKDFASAKPHLMPAVRDAAYESLSLLVSGKGERDPAFEWPSKALVGNLIVGPVYDTEHSITTVNRETLSDWGVGLEEALAVAKENLWDRTDPSRLTGQGGVYWGEWGDSYDSSRVLLTEFIYRLEVDGDPVAFVPNRDSLMITGKHNIAGLRVILKAGAESHFKAGHPVSPDLFVLDDGVWKTYIPEDPSLREIWRATKQNRDALDYAQQKEALDQLPDREDVFIANYMVFQREDGSKFSACVWPKDVDTSLPGAEFVGFVLDAEGNDRFMVPWDEAVSVVGGLLEQEPGLIPVRYRVRQSPDDGQIARLRQLAR